MIGTAVGGVSYSQQSRPNAEGDAPYLEKHAAQAKFEKFLETFQTETEGQQSSDVYKYRYIMLIARNECCGDSQFA